MEFFDFTFSITHLITIASFAVGFIYQWFTVRNKVDDAMSLATAAKDKAEKAEARANHLEVQMIREYASITHIQNVELRLSNSISSLTDEIRDLRKFLMERKT